LEANSGNINKLYQLLNLPLKGSYRLRQHRRAWLERVNELTHIQDKLLNRGDKSNSNSAEWKALTEQLENFYVDKPQTSLIGVKDSDKIESVNSSLRQGKRTFFQHIKEDKRKVFHGVSM
ncbi:FUSC family protein, partial [Vibrio parahaemolyticus]